MTSMQLLFISVSAALGGGFSLFGWWYLGDRARRARARKTAARAGAEHAQPAMRLSKAAEAGEPPKPRSADVGPETELLLRAVNRVQSAVSDLAKVQIEVLQSAREAAATPAPAVDTDRLEQLVARLPEAVGDRALQAMEGAKHDRDKRLEARLDQIMRQRQDAADTALAVRLDKLEKGLEAIFTKVARPTPDPLTEAELGQALGTSLGRLESRVTAALGALATGLAQKGTDPDPQLDRIEAALAGIAAAQAPAAEPDPVGEVTKIAALNGYRRSALPPAEATSPAARTADPAEDSAPDFATGAPHIPAPDPTPLREAATLRDTVAPPPAPAPETHAAGAPDPEEEDAALAAHLTPSEQRLLKTHPGLASILLKKQKLARQG